MAEPILHNQLKIFRAKHDLTQEALAERVGVSRKTINVIEAGNYSPSVTLALAIADVFDVGVNDIFSLEQTETQ